MKKILLTITALLMTSSLYASAADKAKLSSDMRDMLSAMELIQKGGFYSTPKMMKSGVTKLKKGLSSLHSVDASKYLPKEQKHAGKFAIKRASMIEMYADDIISSLEHNDMDDALEDYAQILKQCTSCHLRIRSW